MMKRFLTLALCLLIPAAASAEVLGTAGMYGDQRIVTVEAPNGQTLYVLSMEEEPHVEYADVNFDGREDVVVLTSQGASNGFYQFFVYNGETYERVVWNAGEDMGIPNYVLYPETGLVGARVHEGMVGLMHHEWLFRWEGTQLSCVRYAQGAPYSETIDAETGVVTTLQDDHRVTLRVLEPRTDGADAVLWEETHAITDEAALTAALDAEQAALWEGLTAETAQE